MGKKFIIIFTLCVMVLVIGIFSVPRFLDKETVKDQLMGAFKDTTGLDLEIQGDAVMQTFPFPHIVINSVYVHNAQGANYPFLLSVRLMEIWPSLHSLFGGKLNINRVQISGVEVELERLKDGKMNWAESAQQQETENTTGADSENLFSSTRVILTDGYVRFIDSAAGVNQEFNNIDMTLLSGSAHNDSILNMNVTYDDNVFAVTGRIQDLWNGLYSGNVPASFAIRHGKSELTYEGEIGYKDKKPYVKGNTSLKTDDAVPWIFLFSTGKEKTISGTDYKALPLIAKSEIITQKDNIIFPQIDLEGAIVQGKMHAEITPAMQISLNADIDSLDLESLASSGLFDLKNSIDAAETTPKDSLVRDLTLTPSRSYLNSLALSADIKLQDILYNHQHLKNTHVQFDMTGQEMSISQAISTFPGNSRIIFTGIGKEGLKGFALEGEVDAAGDDFSEMIKVLKPAGLSLPSEDFKRFRLKTNAVISSKEVRFSEFAARIENIAVVGGIIAHLEERTVVEASLRMAGLNLDHFARLWGLQDWRTSFQDDLPGEKSDGFLARWLKRLGYDLKLNILLEQYTFNNQPRDKSDVEIVASMGKIAFNNIKTFYNGTELSGDVSLDVTGPLPKLDVKVTADTLDVSTIMGDAMKPASTAPAEATAKGTSVTSAAVVPASPPAVKTYGNAGRWSHNEIDFHWLELFNTTFHLKFGRFKDGLVTASNVDVQGSVEDQTLNIDALTALIFDSEVAGKASITGGKIPGVVMAANVVSLDIEQLVPFIPVLRGIVGKYNLSIRLDTSGINMASWIANLEGTVGVGGRDVVVNGFNLPGVIRVVSYVRTVADILNVIKRAWPGGDTTFSSVEGQWNVTAGVLKTANARLRNDQADVLLAGEIDLVNWRTHDEMVFSLKALDFAHPPTMTVQFLGDLDKPEMLLDTRSLEEYITNKTSEKMLQQYGTQ